MEIILQLWKIQRTHSFQDLLVPAACPAAHGSISTKRPYLIILVLSRGISSTDASVNPTTTTSNTYFLIFLILFFPVIIIHVFPHDWAIFLVWCDCLLVFNWRLYRVKKCELFNTKFDITHNESLNIFNDLISTIPLTQLTDYFWTYHWLWPVWIFMVKSPF